MRPRLSYSDESLLFREGICLGSDAGESMTADSGILLGFSLLAFARLILRASSADTVEESRRERWLLGVVNGGGEL